MLAAAAADAGAARELSAGHPRGRRRRRIDRHRHHPRQGGRARRCPPSSPAWPAASTACTSATSTRTRSFRSRSRSRWCSSRWSAGCARSRARWWAPSFLATIARALPRALRGRPSHLLRALHDARDPLPARGIWGRALRMLTPASLRTGHGTARGLRISPATSAACAPSPTSPSTVEAGEILGLIGPNGAGKTTVFNLITGFLRPTAGDIRLDGDSIVGLKPHADHAPRHRAHVPDREAVSASLGARERRARGPGAASARAPRPMPRRRARSSRSGSATSSTPRPRT